MQYIDVLVDAVKRTTMVARVESVQNDQYTIRYLSQSKKTGLYNFESQTHDIELESIDCFYENEESMGFIKSSDGWIKQDDSDESEYEPSDSNESESESLEESEEEEDD